MNRHLSLSGVVLGMLAAALTGCGDENSTEKTEQVKSEITARNFATNGCAGSGVFDIRSNQFIDFVALDNSSFSNTDTQLYALDKNNVETLVANEQEMNAADSALTSMFDEATNYTSAQQRSFQLSEILSRTSNATASTSLLDTDETASTSTTTNSARDASSRQFTQTNASGFNDVSSSNDAHSSADSYDSTRAWNSARSGTDSVAEQAARNSARSGQASGASSHAVNSAASDAHNSAASQLSAFNSMARSLNNGGKVGWGMGGFGFSDVANQSQFSRSDVWNSNRASANDYRNSRVGSNAFTDLSNDSYARQAASARQDSFSDVSAANRTSRATNVHNDANSYTDYNRSDALETITRNHDNLSTANSATTRNSASRATRAAARNDAESSALNKQNSRADQAAGSSRRSSASSGASSNRYSALQNLAKYRSNHFVVKVNVTSASNNAIVRLFTGNNASSIAANQDFAQNFNCGGHVKVTPRNNVPWISPAAEAADAVVLGDRVAKPE